MCCIFIINHAIGSNIHNANYSIYSSYCTNQYFCIKVILLYISPLLCFPFLYSYLQSLSCLIMVLCGLVPHWYTFCWLVIKYYCLDCNVYLGLWVQYWRIQKHYSTCWGSLNDMIHSCNLSDQGCRIHSIRHTIFNCITTVSKQIINFTPSKVSTAR